MDNSLINALILGVVEGVTEFLPISSTGHLIVVGYWLGENTQGAKLFNIVIQLGAMFAICWHYRRLLYSLISQKFDWHSPTLQLFKNLIIAFLPAAIIGLLTHNAIKTYLFSPYTVAIALVIGGIVIIVVEQRQPTKTRIDTLEQISGRDALIIGVAQSLALFPGVSRSGATIMGALMWGVNRKTATEFSFLLALPTLLAATLYDLWHNQHLLNEDLIAQIVIGLVASFIAALMVIRGLLYYVSRYKFTAFGIYRIIFGIFILLALSAGRFS